MHDIYLTTFFDGPAAARRDGHRMIAAPETWTVWAHRQAKGVIEISNDPHQLDLWECFEYRRVELGRGYANYVLSSTPDCLIRNGSVHSPEAFEEATNCIDPSHPHYWFPENWPGGRAPAKWTWKDRSAERAAADEKHEHLVLLGRDVGPSDSMFIRDYAAVELWVPDICVPESTFATALWSESGPQGPLNGDVVAFWVSAEKRLAAERDVILNARDALDELRLSPGVTVMPG